MSTSGYDNETTILYAEWLPHISNSLYKEKKDQMQWIKIDIYNLKIKLGISHKTIFAKLFLKSPEKSTA